MCSSDLKVVSAFDMARLMALGAKGVLLGRAWVYALAARGEAGVSHAIDLITAEMRVAMALTGARNVSEITRDILTDLPAGRSGG